MADKLVKDGTEWRAQLTPLQYAVLREKATEQPFTGEYEKTTTRGTYCCAGCGQSLFESDAKFDAGIGWPSFTRPAAEKNIETALDTSDGRTRTEVLCACCNGHLGHVYPDAPTPSGLRYCINSAALNLKPK